MGNKILKTLLITSGILLATTCIAGAEYINSVNYNYDSQRVEITGKDFDDYNGSVATVILLKNGMTLESYTPGTADDDNVEKQTQVVIEDGTFEVSFALNSPVDKTKYTAYIKAGSKTRTSSFVYATDVTSVYDSAVAANTASSFMWVVYNNSTKLGLTDTVYSKLSNAGMLKAGQFAYLDKDAIIKEANGDKEKGVELLKEAARRAAYIQALNEGLIDEVAVDGNFIEPEILGLTDMDVTAYELFTNNTKSTGVEKVLANIQKQNFKSLADFQKCFVYEATIAAIKYNTQSGTAHIKEALKDNNSLNELDFTNYNKVTTNEIDLLLLNGAEWSKDDIQAVLDTEVDTDDKDPSDKTSNGGGSSGGASSIGTYSQNYSIGGLSQTTEPEEEAKVTFTDLGDVEWAREAIEGLATAGVVAGKGDGIFAPLDKVTRAEFLTMLVKTLGVPSEGATCDFVDVTEGEWYYETIAAGTTLGYASGYGNGLFGTYDLITRQDAAVMLNNAVEKNGSVLEAANEGIDFADKDEISDYAAEAVDTLVKAGILSGADGNFMPKNNCTRAEAAVMLWKIMTALGLEG